MTKFCVVLYGPLRTWTRTKDSFVEKILDAVYPVVPDIFVHTYDRNDSTNEIYYSFSKLPQFVTLKFEKR